MKERLRTQADIRSIHSAINVQMYFILSFYSTFQIYIYFERILSLLNLHWFTRKERICKKNKIYLINRLVWLN